MFKSFEGGVERFGTMALRISSEHHLPVGNVAHKVAGPAASPAGGRFLGLVLLFSTETTELLAIMPDGYLQSQRVGATWAIAAKYLAQEDVDTIAVYGSGQQAPAFLEAHCRVRPSIKRAKVYSPTPEHRRAFAERMSTQLEIDVVAVDDPREAARGAGIVMSVNNARVPVVLADWLEPGMHVGAISPGQTDEERFFPKLDRWVAHHRLTSMVFRASEAGNPAQPRRREGDFDLAQVPTLADLLCGRVAGRTAPEEITYFGGRNVRGSADDSFGSSGTGVQFSALGHDIYQRAKATGVGREIPTDWFFETLHP
jgi:ornithine cyclodeaminase/alanine dehydrogenase-like protein (mu-crystallin family)